MTKKIIGSCNVSVAEIRLHRKLKVRKIKRERSIPIFDLTMLSQNSWTSMKPVTEYRVLDRYQHQTVISKVQKEKFGSFRTRLLGSTEQYSCFISPYTQR